MKRIVISIVFSACVLATAIGGGVYALALSAGDPMAPKALAVAIAGAAGMALMFNRYTRI